jgi:hypothetical protein
MASAANEYVVRAPARAPAHAPARGGAPEGFGSLPAELQEEILQHVCVEVAVRQQVWRNWPADMAKSMDKKPLMTDYAAPRQALAGRTRARKTDAQLPPRIR